MSNTTIQEKVPTYRVPKQALSHNRTCAEYFAGIGLVRLGLERAGWNIIFSNDWNYKKFQMYSAYFHNAEKDYLVKDIFDINSSEAPESVLATASFPCIDTSLAGKKKGMKGKHSNAFWGFTEILENQNSRPPLVMIENVIGWITSNKGEDFRIVIKKLNELGYACDVFIINANLFVPQSRQRVFVIGVQTSTPNQNLKTLSQRHSSLTTRGLNSAILDNSDLYWNFLEVPALPNQSRKSLSEIVEKLPEDDSRWWTQEQVNRHLQMMTPINIKHLDELKTYSTYSYRTMYRRIRSGKQFAELRKDKIAGCLRTAQGGSSRQMIVRVGKNTIRMRVMTPREYARLQGVPDDYPLPQNINQALTGFGDAVCVPVITWIGKNILNPLFATLLIKKLSDHPESPVS